LRPDLVHLNGYAHAALPWRPPVLVVAHSCVLSWWRAVHRCDAPPEWDRYRLFVSRGLDGADLVIAPTLAFLRTLRSIYRLETPSYAIWNGRRYIASSAAEKQSVVMTAGRLWDAAKNVATVAQAATNLEHPVWVAGEEPAQSRADALVHLGRLSDDDMRARLEKALIFALPARYDPFGLTALEAAQAGCALVLGDIATQRELWDGAAIFVDPEDTDALTLNLRRLLDEPRMAEAMGALAHRRSRWFTAERMLKRYLRAYAKAAALAPVRPMTRRAATPLANFHSYSE
jgi:glycogen(starch) synthase